MQALLLRDPQDNNLSFPLNIPSFMPSERSDLSQVICRRFDSFEFTPQDALDNERGSAGISSSSKDIQKSANGRRDKYCVISNKVRLELIDLVVNKKEKIKRAAVKLGINYSSAKSIFQVYRKEGRLDKKSSKKVRAKQQSASDTLSESNLTNLSDHIDLIPLDKPLMLPEDISRPIVSQAKLREPSIVSNDCLTDLNQLSIKVKRSEAVSECSTVNTLSYSRNSSGASEIGQYNNIKATAEPPTFFSMLMKKDLASTSDFASQKSACAQGPIIMEVPKPEYQMIPQQQLIQNLLLQQQHQQEGQMNELVKELVKSKLLNHQLNQLRNFKSILAIQNQGLYQPLSPTEDLLKKQKLFFVTPKIGN